jgi:hypothetical protein
MNFLRHSRMNHFEKTDLSPFTIRNYNNCLNKWIEFLKKPLDKIVISPKTSFASLKKIELIKHTPHVYHSYLSAMIAYIKYNLADHPKKDKMMKMWYDLMYKNDTPIREHYKDNKPTEKQAPQALTWDQIEKVRDGLPDGIPKLLLSMYSLLTPERADYFELEICRGQTPTSGNWIDLSKKKLVMTEFKTARKYERLEQDIPEELMRQIHLSVTEKPREYLFVNRFKGPFDRATFSNYANRIISDLFDKRTTLTCIRHAFVTKLDFNKPIRQLDGISSSMGHNMATQKTYAWINEVVHPK